MRWRNEAKKVNAGISVFQKYLTVWVVLCMVAIALFGAISQVALATTVGVLTEVPVMLMLVRIANSTRKWFQQEEKRR